MAFPVTCPACGKAFQLATEIYERKVAGKIVSIKCKQCQAGIRVDATKPGELKVLGATPAGGGDLSVGPRPPEAKAAAPAASPELPKPAPVRMRQPTLIGMVNPLAGAAKAPAAAAPARPAAASTPALWAVDAGGDGDDRELNEDEILHEIRAGKLTAQTLAWREGMGEWLEIDKIPELSRYLAFAGTEEPKTVPPPPREQRAGFQDEPDAEATMVYDRSAPNAAFEAFAGIDQDTTARVELPPKPTSEDVTARVFGQTIPLANPPPAIVLGAGRSAATPQKSAPGDPPPPPLPPAGRAAPFAKTAPAADPPAPPLPPPAPQAPPVAARAAPPPTQPAAEAPPPAPAFPSPPAHAPALAAVPWGDPLPSAKPAVPGLPTAPYGPDPFAVAATTDLDFPNPKSKRPLVVALAIGAVVVIGIVIAVATSGSPPVANIAPPAPPPTTPTPSDSPKTEPTAQAEPTRDDSRGSNAPATQPQTPSGNFSDLFSKGAEKAKGSASKGFNETEAREALSGLLKTAAACKEPGAQMGQTTATVTFEASGNVSGVTVGAPFAGTSTGTCVITAFKRAKVAPFTGLPGTVVQTISLR